jgi:hypothetical protein
MSPWKKKCFRWIRTKVAKFVYKSLRVKPNQPFFLSCGVHKMTKIWYSIICGAYNAVAKKCHNLLFVTQTMLRQKCDVI